MIRQYTEKQRESARTRAKIWSKANCERVRANQKAWAVANPERVRTRQKAWTNLNYATNPNFKIRVNYSCLIKNVLKKDCGKKAFKTMRLLDCDIPYLRAWLEIQFRPGMTWENRGPIWHIDHKKPCSKFDLTDPLEQRRCFHWMNLQPLFAFENLSKGAKWEPEAA